jgi:hypothetical protein
MANNRNPNEKQPGEKSEGKYHYNPGNQSAKEAEIYKGETECVNNRDVIDCREKPHSRSQFKKPGQNP